MMSFDADPRIDTYIDGLPGWQQKICREVRTIVHDADPEVVETIKRTNRPYFTLQGNIAALLGTADHVNVFIYDPIAPDPQHIISAGEGNATARLIQFYEGDKVPGKALGDLFRAVIANNRAGGWRKVRK